MTATLLLACLALAQEPETTGPPPGWVELTPVDGPSDGGADLGDDVDYEVVVWGEHAIRQARSEVVRAMEVQGWRKAKDQDGVLVFKGPKPWMGRARLYRDGRFDFSRPVMVVTGVETQGVPGFVGDPNPRTPPEHLEYGADIDRQVARTGNLGGVNAAGAAGMGFQAPGKRKVEAAQARVLIAVRPEVGRYGAVIRETAFQEAIEDLPARLDRLWEHGEPLEDGGESLATLVERRAAILDHWATRADTPEGDGVRRAVALWLRETIMDSDHPVTPSERAQAEQAAGRRLHLRR